jgi:transcriptional regulator with XRE-family HTH domain
MQQFLVVLSMLHRRRFAETLREARVNAEISQEELAERAGLHRTYISQLERGLKSPSLDVIVALAKGLGKTPLEFVSRIFSEGGKK